jgi:hypothetical protein
MKYYFRILMIMFLAIGICFLGMTRDADAAFKLRMTEGVNVVTVTDNGVGDLNPIAGSIGFAGAVGNFTFNIIAGKAKPAIGSAEVPELSLISSNSSASLPGTLFIELTDTGYGPSQSPLVFANAINGALATTGVVNYSSYIDNSNAEFGHGTLVKQLGPGSGNFDLEGNGSVATSNPYSVTMEMSLVHTGQQESQFDASMTAQPIPEPSTLLLLGSGLLGVIGYTKFRLSGRKKPSVS